MDAQAAAAAAAHRRVKRAMGLLRGAAQALAAEAAELDLVGELHLDPDELAPARELELVEELLKIIRARHRGELDVIILAAPARSTLDP